MKISYNDMFTNISDVAYEILEENDMFNDETDDMFSSDRTCKDVTDMIHDQKIVKKKAFCYQECFTGCSSCCNVVYSCYCSQLRCSIN